MTVARTPSLAHWGAFTALVENGRVIGCEPFARDALPSPMLDAMPEMVHSPLRIARPAIREGWREGRPRTGADRFREVSLGRGARSGRRRADAGARHLRRHRYFRRLLRLVVGRDACIMRARWCVASCFSAAAASIRSETTAWGAAQFLLPHVIGTYQPVTGRVTDWNSVVKHTRLMIAFGGLRAQEQPGDVRRHRLARAGIMAAAGPRPPASNSW